MQIPRLKPSAEASSDHWHRADMNLNMNGEFILSANTVRCLITSLAILSSWYNYYKTPTSEPGLPDDAYANEYCTLLG